MDDIRANGQTPSSSGGASHEGLKPTQEDRYDIHTLATADGLSATLLLVADGVGGQSAGELASHLAIQAVHESLVAAEPSSGELAEALAEALRQANGRLHRDVVDHPDRSGMATTLTAVAVVGNRLVLAHVGDSRAYLLRKGTLHQLTVDHTWAEEAIRAGRSVEEVRRHPNRNVIKRYLGINTSVEVDTRYHHPGNPNGALVDAMEQPLFLTAEDSVFLCSDGVTDVLAPQAIAMIIRRLPAQQAAQAIVDAALRAGASDNVTAVVLDLPQAPKRKFALPKALVYAGLALLLVGGSALAASMLPSRNAEGPPGFVAVTSEASAAPGQSPTANTGMEPPTVAPKAPDGGTPTPGETMAPTSTMVAMELDALTPTSEPSATLVASQATAPSIPSSSATGSVQRMWRLVSPSEGPEWVHGEVVTLRWQCSPGLAAGEQFSLRITHEGSANPVLADHRPTGTSYEFRPDPLKTGRYDWEVLILRQGTSQIVARQGWHFSWAPSAQQPGGPTSPPSVTDTPRQPTATGVPTPITEPPTPIPTTEPPTPIPTTEPPTPIPTTEPPPRPTKPPPRPTEPPTLNNQ